MAASSKHVTFHMVDESTRTYIRDELIQVDSMFFDAYYNLSATYGDMQDFKSAEFYAKKVARLGSIPAQQFLKRKGISW